MIKGRKIFSKNEYFILKPQENLSLCNWCVCVHTNVCRRGGGAVRLSLCQQSAWLLWRCDLPPANTMQSGSIGSWSYLLGILLIRIDLKVVRVRPSGGPAAVTLDSHQSQTCAICFHYYNSHVYFPFGEKIKLFAEKIKLLSENKMFMIRR